MGGAAGKVTAGTASHWPCITDFSGLSINQFKPQGQGDETAIRLRSNVPRSSLTLTEYDLLYLYVYTTFVIIVTSTNDTEYTVQPVVKIVCANSWSSLKRGSKPMSEGLNR